MDRQKNINRNLSRRIAKETVWFCKHLHSDTGSGNSFSTD